MRTALERHAALLVLGAAGGLAGASALFSAGSSSSRLLWLGLSALVLSGAAATLGALGWWPVLGREAVIALALLVAFVCWCGVSILWSIEPDRSWDYLNRGLVYIAFAVVGLAVGAFVPRAARLWASVLAVVVALALGWALLGKAIPWVDGSGRIARLSSPVDYWNGLGLVFDFGLPLALWLAARRDHPHWVRAAGTVFLYGLTIGLLLTYSRAGIAVGVVAVAVWLAFGGPRVEGAAALLLGGAFGLGVGVAALPYLASLSEARQPLTDARRLLVGRLALSVLAVGAVAGAIALVATAKPQSWLHDFTRVPTNPAETGGAGRLTSINSNSRWQWWEEAWRAFEQQPARGTGAGTFELSHRLFRTSRVVVTEPHTVVDFDFDFIAVTGPFLLSVGVLLAGGSVRSERRLALAPVPAALVMAVAYSLLAPWFAQRASDSALAALEAGRPAQVVGHAQDARSLNPFSLEPVFFEAGAAEQLGDLAAARRLYVKAIELQPLNWRPWYELGSFEFDLLNYRAAVAPLQRAVELDPQGTLAPGLLQQAKAKLGSR